MKIHLFQQCLIDMFYPHVGMAGVEVLERLGRSEERRVGKECR